MQAKSFADTAEEPDAVRRAFAAANFTPVQRAFVLALNCLPLLHMLFAVALAVVPFAPVWCRAFTAIVATYLLPPLLVRGLFSCRPISSERIVVGSVEFFIWWAAFQLQGIFCRFPALEEFLRLVPGLYSFWLKLWGARIGRLTFWAAGTLILDRPFLRIGDQVVFGAGVRLNAHVLARNGDGALELLLAPIKIGDRAVIGGYSLLTAGTEIADDETTRAFLVSPPFSSWKNGKRFRGTDE